MTIEEAAKIGERLLSEYKDRLQVQDVQPYRRQDAPLRIAKRHDCHLTTANPEEIERYVREVLEELTGKGDFIMVGPEYLSMDCTETKNIEVGKLRLTLTYGTSIVDLKSYLWVACWFRPAAR